MTIASMRNPRVFNGPTGPFDCPDDVLEFCAAMSGLSGKSIVDVRDELVALPIPAGYTSLVIREFSAWRKIGDITVHGEREVNAFDVVRLLMMTPFQATWDWVRTDPLLEAPADVAAISEQTEDPAGALVIVVHCRTCPTDAPLGSPSRRELLGVNNPAVRVC